MGQAMSYNDLEIYRLAHSLAAQIHKMSLGLPKFEMFEEGSQIRRSAKSISANIVEGFGRRRYKPEFIRYLVSAHASCDETIEHLKILKDTQSISAAEADRFLAAYDELGRKMNRFIESVERGHKT